MDVIKRDGSIVEFNRERIINALANAFLKAEGKISYTLISQIAENVQIWNKIHIEDIQDQLEELLQDFGYDDVYKEFAFWRRERAIQRALNDKLLSRVRDKLEAKDVQNQNANVDEYAFGGRMGEANRVVTKEYALNYCMSELARTNHLNNEIYIHDLDSYAVGMHNCLSIPFDDLLAHGFNTRQTDVRPANSVNTAFQLVAVIFQLQSLQQFGGVSATHLDWTMVPYIRKSFYKHYCTGMKYIHPDKINWGIYVDENGVYTPVDDTFPITHKFYFTYYDVFLYARNQTEKELQQSVEGLYHNLNTLQSRSGNQLPFTSINYGTCTLEEGRMVTEALLQGSLKGVGKHKRTPIFPCGIFQCMKGVNTQPTDPNYDLFRLALKSTSKRLYPNYANVDWSGNAGYDPDDPRTYFSTMGCRTANGYDINGFGQLKDGRGNICPVTIILPTLAMEAHRNVAEFMELLDKKIHEAKDMLLERFDWICSQSPESAKFMYENQVMAGYIPSEGIRSALRHGTLAIGQIALAETLQLLIGEDHTSAAGMALAKRIEQLFKTRCAEFKEFYSLNFGVYYTPAENLCHTALKKFRDTYGVIPNVSDREYFTNSIHVPVWHECTPFEKIDIESELTGYSSAGCITYVELPSSVEHNLDALEAIVKYGLDKDVPYIAINIPNDICLDCGYTGEFNDTCPECGGHNIQHLRRVTGYLTGDYKTAFNPGKIDETEDRVKHIKSF